MLPLSPVVSGEVLVVIWTNILLLLGALTLEARRHPYSLHLMHLVSLFLFLGAASLFQYSVGRMAIAGPIQPMHSELLTASLAVTLWVVVYVTAFETQRRLASGPGGRVVRFFLRPVTPRRSVFFLSLAIVSLVYLASLGLAGVSTRGATQSALQEAAIESAASGYGVAYYVIHNQLLRAASLVAVLAALVVISGGARNPILLLLTVAAGIATLVTNNPFASARMWFATALIAYAAPFLLRRLRTGWGIVLIALGGLALMPALHQTRNMETLDEFGESAALVSPLRYLASNSDVDSLGMLSLCQRWLEGHPHRWGTQTLGALLHWFPRALWPQKPTETGGLVTGDLGFEFTNLAPPVMSDPLIDFGFPGIVLAAAVFGIVFARLDRAYWDVRAAPSQVRAIDCIYPFWLGCVIFITRGGSFSSLSFTAGFTFWVIPLVAGLSRATRSARRIPDAAPDVLPAPALHDSYRR